MIVKSRLVVVVVVWRRLGMYVQLTHSALLQYNFIRIFLHTFKRLFFSLFFHTHSGALPSVIFNRSLLLSPYARACEHGARLSSVLYDVSALLSSPFASFVALFPL